MPGLQWSGYALNRRTLVPTHAHLIERGGVAHNSINPINELADKDLGQPVSLQPAATQFQGSDGWWNQCRTSLWLARSRVPRASAGAYASCSRSCSSTWLVRVSRPSCPGTTG